MIATLRGAQTELIACQSRSKRMPSSQCAGAAMSAKEMAMWAAAAASVFILKTDVWTSVSLFPRVFVIVPLLLISVVVLISLLLTGLTGQTGLESLVGRTREQATMTVWGD